MKPLLLFIYLFFAFQIQLEASPKEIPEQELCLSLPVQQVKQKGYFRAGFERGLYTHEDVKRALDASSFPFEESFEEKSPDYLGLEPFFEELPFPFLNLSILSSKHHPPTS